MHYSKKFCFAFLCMAIALGVDASVFTRFQFNFPNPNATTAAPAVAGLRPAVGAVRPLPATPQPFFVGGPIPFAPCTPEPLCPVTPSMYYKPDGSCNNLVSPKKGAANEPLKRLIASDYADGKGKPRTGKNGKALPSPRVVSKEMQESVHQNSPLFSQLLPFFGQYIIHDVGNTPTSNRANGVNCFCGNNDPACFNIPLGITDIQRITENKICLPLVRSLPSPDAHCNTKIRQQRNAVTAFIDAGTVYGSSEHDFRQLFVPGTAKLKSGNLHPHGYDTPTAPSLPLTTAVDAQAANTIACPADIHRPPTAPCFFAGDERVNEIPVLTSFHTLFLRLHNHLVVELKKINPHWGSERLIQEARKINAALHQQILFGEFLPIVLGPTYMKRFGLNLVKKGYWYGYDPSYDATVANAFATAAFRFGHTLVPPVIQRFSPSWTPIQPPLILRDNFFSNIPLLTPVKGGANSILRGASYNPSLSYNPTFSEEMRNFLFAPTGRFGHDLLSINLQRGRDHGLPGYNAYRSLVGLKKANSFNDFVEMPASRRSKLKKLYKNVDDVDLYIAGISERSVSGGVVGPTFAYLIGNQFRSIRRGDRFWYENGALETVFTPDQLRELRKVSLSALMCTLLKDTRTIQPNPLLQATAPNNYRRSCNQFPFLNWTPWVDNGPRSTPEKNPTTEKTAYFPLDIGQGKWSPIHMLRYLQVYRPADVCTRVIGINTRVVNGRNQVRFICPVGSIKATPYPATNVKAGVWTKWEDNSTPRRPRYDDDETRNHETHECVSPIAIQVTTLRGTPASETGEVFTKFSPIEGFLCRGQDQRDRKCLDYRVRYLCRKIRKGPIFSNPTNPTPTCPTVTSPVSGNKWTQWISQSVPSSLYGDVEYLSGLVSTAGYCPKPLNMQVRVVGSHILASATGQKFHIYDKSQGFVCLNSDQRFYGRCYNYEVRYLCKKSDIIAPVLPQAYSFWKQFLCSQYSTCC